MPHLQTHTSCAFDYLYFLKQGIYYCLLCKICNVISKTESNLKQCDLTIYLSASPPLGHQTSMTTVSIWHTAILLSRLMIEHKVTPHQWQATILLL